MSVNAKSIINQINKNCEELDFAESRRLIEFNVQMLSNPSHYRLLSENAKALVKHVTNQLNNKENTTLSRLDRLKINNINTYCSDFDISMLKRTLKDSIDLIQRPDVQLLLNNDAKMVLKTMGALLGDYNSIDKVKEVKAQ